MHLLFSKFFSPDDTPGTGSGDGGKETIELLNEEPEETLDLTPPPAKKEVQDEGEEADQTTDETDEGTGKEEETDELAEIEAELEGPKEEDLELTTPVRRREILAKYPQLFKDFPYLEKAYYREQQFTELLPTISDAKLAVEKASAFDNLDQQVMSGDISSVLYRVKSGDPEVFNKIADDYLPTLKAVDSQAYYHVLGNVIKDTIITMVREGRALGEQGAPLTAAANVLNQFVFGSQNFTPPRPLSKQIRPEDQNREQQFQEQERQRVMSTFESTKDDLQVRADNVLKSTIDQHIDPNGSMTDYVKRTATREAFETLENLMSKDTRFRSILDKLWERAFQQGFNRESQEKIKAAYLSKAKTLLPSVIKKARNDALRGLGRRSREENTDTEQTPKKGPITPGRSTSPSSGKFKKASDIPRGMSTLDVLMRD